MAKTLKEKKGISLLGNNNPSVAAGQAKRLERIRRGEKKTPLKNKAISSAKKFAESLRPIIETHWSEGKTIEKMVAIMNKSKLPTRQKGKRWGRTQVVRVLERLNLK